MFTGLVQCLGVVNSIKKNSSGMELQIKAPELIPSLKIDDSVAINGACQTVVKVQSPFFVVQTVATTLAKTNLGQLKILDQVNLELALMVGDRLGGHFVTGHVNAVTKIVRLDKISNGQNYVMTLELPDIYSGQVVDEGSVTLEGVSLTVSNVDNNLGCFQVSVIPHTYAKTTLGNKKVGDSINLEIDIFARYIAGQLKNIGKGHDSTTLGATKTNNVTNLGELLCSL